MHEQMFFIKYAWWSMMTFNCRVPAVSDSPALLAYYPAQNRTPHFLVQARDCSSSHISRLHVAFRNACTVTDSFFSCSWIDVSWKTLFHSDHVPVTRKSERNALIKKHVTEDNKFSFSSCLSKAIFDNW